MATPSISNISNQVRPHLLDIRKGSTPHQGPIPANLQPPAVLTNLVPVLQQEQPLKRVSWGWRGHPSLPGAPGSSCQEPVNGEARPVTQPGAPSQWLLVRHAT
jgi:hypothetical protein